jgi:CRISPR-associated protein Cmr2
MTNDSLEYINPLTNQVGQCRILVAESKQQYVDESSGAQLLLHAHPMSNHLNGLTLDEVAGCHRQFKDDLNKGLQQAIKNNHTQQSALIIAAETLFGVLVQRIVLPSKKSAAILNLPSDARPGRNTASLRDHSLIISGIAAALARGLLIKGYQPGDIGSGITLSTEAEAIALVRLVAMSYYISNLPISLSLTPDQDFVKGVFTGVLSDEVQEVLVEASKRQPENKRKRMGGLAPETLLQEIVCYSDAATLAPELSASAELDSSGDVEIREWEERYFKDEPPLALLAADVDRVQEYVFESAKLSEMRGSSLILDLLNVKDDDDTARWGNIRIDEQLLKGIPQVLKAEFGLPQESIIYAAGGGALMIVPQELVEKIARRIERLYVETTLTATISAVHVPVSLRDLALGIDSAPTKLPSLSQAKGEAWRLLKHNLVSSDEWTSIDNPNGLTEQHFQRNRGFGQLQSVLGHQLRQRKDSKESAPLFEVSPLSERCAYCQLRPAYRLALELDERPICRACNIKRIGSKNRAAQSLYIRRFKSFLNIEAARGNELPYLREANNEDWSEIEAPPDLETIAKAAARKNNYVGIIYADGNDLGAMLDSLETPTAFKSFAETVRRAVESAVFSGLGSLLKPYKETQREQEQESSQSIYHPFEIVSIGGDDVYLFVPADIALEMALHICNEVERAFNGKITLAAGVLIAHVSSPVYFSRTIVKGLLKNAKRLSKAGAQTTSAVDFQVITSDTAISEDVAGFRERTYYKSRYDEWLTTRPLRLDRFRELIELVRTMKAQDFPLTQLYALREAVVRGPQPRATNFYYYQQARSNEMKRKYRPLDTFLNREVTEAMLPFWQQTDGLQQGKRVTPIVDIAEIYKFIRGA